MQTQLCSVGWRFRSSGGGEAGAVEDRVWAPSLGHHKLGPVIRTPFFLLTACTVHTQCYRGGTMIGETGHLQQSPAMLRHQLVPMVCAAGVQCAGRRGGSPVQGSWPPCLHLCKHTHTPQPSHN